MILTYYEYINESRGISNFIKKLSTIISGRIFKELENNSNSYNIEIPIDFIEIDKIKSLNIKIVMIQRNYHCKFYNNGNSKLNDLVLEFDLPNKSDLNYYYLHELIVHELTHLYEYYNIITKEMEFPLYDRIKKSLIKTIKQDDFDIFSYFRNLVYLSLDNELNARVSQTYQLLSFYKIDDKEKLNNILKTTHIWKKYKEIDNFNPKKYTSDLIEILGIDFTKILINDFNTELKNNSIDFTFIKNVDNEEDIIKYFNNWKKRFRYKLKKHIYKLDKIIDEVILDKNK